MLERGDGHYVITSSVAGRRALPGSLYSATKFAATAIGEALRQELRQMKENDRIKVTLIEPGITDTEFFDDKPAEWALRDEDIAREVLHALTEPAARRRDQRDPGSAPRAAAWASESARAPGMTPDGRGRRASRCGGGGGPGRERAAPG